MVARAAVSVVALLFGLSAAVARDGVLLYAGFDGTADARAAGDGKAQGEQGGPRFATGLRGQGLLSGDAEGSVSYAVEHNLLPEQGSVEFWVQPVDWSGDDAKFHVFFDADTPGWLVLYKFHDVASMNGKAGLVLSSARHSTWDFATASLAALKPNTWHHLAATWNREQLVFYVDGVASAPIPTPQVPAGLTGRFQFGDRPWGIARNARSVLDELYVYDRALTPAEVTWAYQHGKDRPAGEDTPAALHQPLAVGLVARPSAGELDLNVDVGGLDTVRGTARLEPAAGTAPAAVEPVSPRHGRAVIPFRALPAGEYQVQVEVTDGEGKPVGHRSLPLRSPGPPTWRGNRLGVPTEVPPPFTPVTCAAQGETVTLACWGRTYELGALALPRQITALGQPLLAAPVTLAATAGAALVAWQAEPLKVVEQGPLGAVVEGRAASAVGMLRATARFAYDGFLQYDLRLEPATGAPAGALALRVPLRADQATLDYVLQSTQSQPVGTFGATPTGQGVVMRSPFAPYAWLGNEDRGLSVSCESDAAWEPADRTDAFRLERDATSVTQVQAFRDTAPAKPTPWAVTFALQASPVKATPGWRQWRMTPAMNLKELHTAAWHRQPGYHDVLCIWPTPDLLKWYGYPAPTDPAGFKAMAAQAHREGLAVMPYSLIMGLFEQVPEWSLYRDEWGNGGIFRTGDVGVFNSALFTITPNPDWIDYIVWTNAKYLDEYGFDGWYHDCTQMVAATNRLGGHGYLRDGQVRPTYPIFAMRTLYERMYVLLKDWGRRHGRETFMMEHMSGYPLTPYLGFCDGYLDGENLGGRVKDNYLEVVSLPQWRAEFMGRNLGTMPYLLPEFPNAVRTEPKPTRHLAGLALLHDFGLWPIWCHTAELDRIHAALADFPLPAAKLAPYWANGELIGGQSDAVKVSAYTVPGRALLVLVNTTRQDQPVSLTVDWGKLLGRAPATVSDKLGAGPVAADQARLTLTLPGLDARVIEAK